MAALLMALIGMFTLFKHVPLGFVLVPAIIAVDYQFPASRPWRMFRRYPQQYSRCWATLPAKNINQIQILPCLTVS